MSVEAMTWAFQVPLKPCPKSVLIALANRADEDGYCWPGLEDLERRTGWNKRSIQRAILYLQEQKLLSVTPRFASTGVQTSNLYRVSMTPISCGEGDRVSGVRVTGCHGEGDRVSGVRVTACHGEGDRVSPEYSSEQSIEQSIEHPPISPPKGAVVCGVMSSPDFDQFWQSYPRKTGKKAAWRAWCKATDRPALSMLLDSITLQSSSQKWQEGIIPNPATWLNQGRWLDEAMVTLKPVSSAKACRPAPVLATPGEPCPPEAAAKLAKILGRGTFSFPAESANVCA